MATSTATSPNDSHGQQDSYTIHVRGDVFHLSHSQISFDSPNYFTACFESGFAEARERTLRLDRHPALFAIVVDYLSGYPVLPLSTRAIPATMDMQTALRFLLADAQFYELQGLCDLLTLPSPPMDLSWAGFASKFVHLRDVLNDTLPEGVVKTPDGSVVAAESELPVFVYARNMVIKFVTTNKLEKPHLDDCREYEASYFLEVSCPSATAAACVHTPSVASSNAPSDDSALLRTSSVHVKGSMTVDGHTYDLSSVEFRCTRTRDTLYWLRPPLRDGPHVWTSPFIDDAHFEWEHRAWTFWAEEIITCFSAGLNPGSASSQATPATLISAKMRTLPRILAELTSQSAT
ncbi:hypothetical protein L226DRAFT_536983 [Lentinus tigrinus ALCF2SS1-7]|uniref:BTB domain-containing protein n=1 Tax=Lentinus tigrinus ALCF2SS1-6 TaxID=1328759 RepID=A0A5C2S4T5_9APHY|nr:hypothetical protein L227DRAFT_654632 [Lentinus tigrinus ALCF2SS1-6]RPD72812.1 hypothetical protein L226DRAFT_536983 [Lentinus tigrinus ALCF2SS1-7]